MPFYYCIALDLTRVVTNSFVAKVYNMGVVLFIICFWFIARAIAFFFGIAIVQAQISLLWWNSIPLAELHLLCEARGKNGMDDLKQTSYIFCYWPLSPHDSPALQTPFHLSVVNLLLCMCSGSVHKQLNTMRTIPIIQEQLLKLGYFTDEWYSLCDDSYRRKTLHGWMGM